MKKERTAALLVGFMVLAGLAAFTVFILSVSDFSFLQKGKVVHVLYDYAAGVKPAAPVRVAGVDAGLVKDVALYEDVEHNTTKVRITVWLKDNVRLSEDSVFYINHLGILGEKYIEIIPGRRDAPALLDGAVVRGKDPIMQEKIAEKVLHVAEKADRSIDAINGILEDEETKTSIRNLLKHLETTTQHWERISAALEQGQGTLGRLLFDDRLYDELEAFAADLRANPWKLLFRPKDKQTKTNKPVEP